MFATRVSLPRLAPALALLCASATLDGQSSTRRSVDSSQARVEPAGAPAPRYLPVVPGAATVPFAVGERLDYDVKFGPIDVGDGSLRITEVTDVRGEPSWHAVFTIKGGIPFFRVDDKTESWFDVRTLSSRRFVQNIKEGNYKRNRRYEIYPERAVYQQEGQEEKPSVSAPLDDASFLYYVRTLPLVVGETYTVPRYFNPAGNPVQITVLRRETVEVPAGRFTALVIRPTFKTRGIFSEDGQAEVWISDDSRRLVVQLKSKLSFGSLGLSLRSMIIPDATVGASASP